MRIQTFPVGPGIIETSDRKFYRKLAKFPPKSGVSCSWFLRWKQKVTLPSTNMAPGRGSFQVDLPGTLPVATVVGERATFWNLDYKKTINGNTNSNADSLWTGEKGTAVATSGNRVALKLL